jgi:hypothetical protein
LCGAQPGTRFLCSETTIAVEMRREAAAPATPIADIRNDLDFQPSLATLGWYEVEAFAIGFDQGTSVLFPGSSAGRASGC